MHSGGGWKRPRRGQSADRRRKALRLTDPSWRGWTALIAPRPRFRPICSDAWNRAWRTLSAGLRCDRGLSSDSPNGRRSRRRPNASGSRPRNWSGSVKRVHGHHPRAPFQERGAGQNSPDNKESVMSEQAITDELFGMMKVAQAQQETVETCLRALTAERIALAKERAALAQQTEAVRQAASAALVVIRKAVGEAVGVSMKEALAGISGEAAQALGEAAKPVIARLTSVAQTAGQTESALRKAGQWFAWKWVAVAAGGLMGVCLFAYAALAWQLHQVKNLRAEKAQLQANVAMLEKRGGKMVILNCGGRLCIEASRNQGKGAERWKGANWRNEENGAALVIPRGY